jgi:hypothetical protein
VIDLESKEGDGEILEMQRMSSSKINTLNKLLRRLSLKAEQQQLKVHKIKQSRHQLNKNLKSHKHQLLNNTTRTKELRLAIPMRRKFQLRRLTLILNGLKKRN